VNGTTLLLWFGPFVLLVAGVALLIAYLRRRSARLAEAAPALSTEERRKLDALLEDSGKS
jgi:cytochrome c-type biogenesis protein CcmH